MTHAEDSRRRLSNLASRARAVARRARQRRSEPEAADPDADSEHIVVGREKFLVWPQVWLSHEAECRSDEQVVFKSMRLVRRYLELAASRPHPMVVELGIYQGGSVAFLYEAFSPDRVVAFDIETEPASRLERYIDERGLRDRVCTHYGVDQADTSTLLRLLAADVGTAPLDIVIDDASHLYAPTRASFEALFPLLRDGGIFVIEDWVWAHIDAELWQKDGGVHPDEPALTNVLVEILMLAGTRPDVVREIRVSRGTVEIVRGDAPIDAPMDMTSLTRNRGKTFEPLL